MTRGLIYATLEKSQSPVSSLKFLYRRYLSFLVFLIPVLLFFTGCSGPADPGTTPVTNIDAAFTALAADGSATAATTTYLTLTFDKDITGLAAGDITLTPNSTGAVKGDLSYKSTGVYQLALTNVSAAGQISVTVSKAGYNISPPSKNIYIYYYDSSATAAAFNNLSANGSAGEATTTTLTLTFDKDITGLTAANITIEDPQNTEITKGDLTRTGTGEYQLAVSGITAAGQISVTVSKAGYTISPPNRTVDVFYYSGSTDMVDFTGLSGNGAEDETTTLLTFTFDKDIADLTAADITIEDPQNTGTTKGELTPTGTGEYQLAVSGITKSGEITMRVSKDGYNITPPSRKAYIYCYDPSATAVSFNSLSADGSGTKTTTTLTLTFSDAIEGLTAADITITQNGTGITRGALTYKGGGVYELGVSGITQDGNINVSVSKAGYDISGASQYVYVFYHVEYISLYSISQNGSSTQSTTELILTFSNDITDLAAADITITPDNTGAVIDSLTNESIGVYKLEVSGITQGGDISVSVSKYGYNISPDSQNVTVYYYGTPNAGIDIGDPSVKLYLDGGESPLEEGGTTEIDLDTGTYTVSIPNGTYTEIIWYLNGNMISRGKINTSIMLQKRIAGTYLLTVEVSPLDGEENTGSHIFVVQ